MPVHQMLGGPPAHEHGHLVFQLFSGHQIAVFGGPLDGVAQRADAARNDGHLVHRIAARQAHRHQRMPHFVMRHDVALFRVEQSVALFQPGDDALDRAGKVRQGDGARVFPRGQQGRLVHQIGQIGAGEPGRERCHLLQIDAGIEPDLDRMHLENLHPPYLVGPLHQHLSVKSPGAQQGGIENLRPVGGRENHNGRGGVEAVEFDQQLIERLLFFIVPAAERRGAAGAAQRIELVDENDGRRFFPRLLEQVAHPRRAHADEHLHKFRAADGEKRHPGLPGHGARQQRLAYAGRPHQQHALGRTGAEAAVLDGVLQKIDHFFQLGLGFVHPGDVGKSHPGAVFHINLRPALADGHETPHAHTPGLVGKLAHQKKP